MSSPTPSQTVGPFFGFALPFDRGAVSDGDGIRIEGQVLDGAGEPVPDALLEISEGEQFARCRTDMEGAYHFVVKSPGPGYFDVAVFARGLLRHLNTRLYLPGQADAVLESIEPARRGTLVAREDAGALRFDVRLQGKDETVFFA